MNILVGGIGYSNLGDMSFGRVLNDTLATLSWPDGVYVEDLNFGPIMIYQWLEASPIKFDRAVLLTAEKRGDAPGTLRRYRWVPLPLSEMEIQMRVEEAVTGVISLENLLIICRHFGVLPDDVVVIEIEPASEEWGHEFSPVVAAKVEEALMLVQREVAQSG